MQLSGTAPGALQLPKAQDRRRVQHGRRRRRQLREHPRAAALEVERPLHASMHAAGRSGRRDAMPSWAPCARWRWPVAARSAMPIGQHPGRRALSAAPCATSATSARLPASHRTISGRRSRDRPSCAREAVQVSRHHGAGRRRARPRQARARAGIFPRPRRRGRLSHRPGRGGVGPSGLGHRRHGAQELRQRHQPLVARASIRTMWIRPYGGDKADPALVARYEALGKLPQNTFGKALWDFDKRNGYPFPGDPTALNAAFGTPHDSTHVISGYDTSCARRAPGLDLHRRHASDQSDERAHPAGDLHLPSRRAAERRRPCRQGRPRSRRVLARPWATRRGMPVVDRRPERNVGTGSSWTAAEPATAGPNVHARPARRG